MASGTFRLLLQSVQQCIDFLEICKTETSKLATQHRLNKYWLSGLAGDFERISKDLQSWRSGAETKNNEQDEEQFLREVTEDLTRCEYVLAILRHTWAEVQKLVSGKDVSPKEKYETEAGVSKDIETVDQLVDVIKSLNSFFSKGPSKPLGSQTKIGNASLRTLFVSRIEQMHPDQRTRSFSVLHRGCVDFEKLDLFWDCVLRPEGIYSTTDRSKTFDGILIRPEHIAKAQTALEEFREAWLEVNPEGSETHPRDPPSLDNLPLMPIIACVLHACGRRELFNDFVSLGIKDSALDQPPEALLFHIEQAVGYRVDAREVVAQFSRAKQRPWHKNTKLELTWSEPLPLIEVRPLRRTTNRPALGVFEVQDAWDPCQRYALKVFRPGTADQDQRQQLEDEIKRLMELDEEDHELHFIRCIKSYVRGSQQQQEIGMIMTPVANGDLNKALIRCCTDQQFRTRNRADLIRACGCLAYSLAYLHNVKGVRHRDIKPDNVLYYKPDPDSRAEFLWADFGLATVFRDQCFSGTENPGFGATPEYEAPEVDPSTKGIHSRAIDIFALGCVFLEIVCALSMPHNKVRDTLEIRQLYWYNNTFYKHHLKGLKSSIDGMEKILTQNKDSQLLTILKVAQSMISQRASDRPRIGRVVDQLRRAGLTEMFCTRCQEMMKVDFGKSPKHPGIFEHKQRVSFSSPPRPGRPSFATV